MLEPMRGGVKLRTALRPAPPDCSRFYFRPSVIAYWFTVTPRKLKTSLENTPYYWQQVTILFLSIWRRIHFVFHEAILRYWGRLILLIA